MYFLLDRNIRFISLIIVIFSAVFLLGPKVKAVTYVDCECKINFEVHAGATETGFMGAAENECKYTIQGKFNPDKKTCADGTLIFKGANSQVNDCGSIDGGKIKEKHYFNTLGQWQFGGDNAAKRDITFHVVSCKSLGDATKTGGGAATNGGSSAGAGMTASSLMKLAAKKMNPTSLKSPQQLIGYAIKFDMAALGGIALALYIWAGLLWMTSGGNSERRDKAMKTLVWVTFGVIIIFASYLVMKFVFEQIILK